MALTSARKIRAMFRNRWVLRFPAALLSFVALAGCNTCVIFTSNPPNGTLGIVSSDPRPACTIPKVTMSAVRLRMTAQPLCPSCVGSGQIQHIFLGIRGIELNQSAAARDDSPDWQELLPEDFAVTPLQIDLMEGKADAVAPRQLTETAQFPSGIYRDLRVRFAPNQPATADRLPEKSMCGSGVFNCVVMADGSIQQLLLDEESPEFHVTPDTMESASLFFPPDTRTDLLIEWKLAWELSSSANAGVRLLPTLAGSAQVSRIKLNELGTLEGGVGNDSRSR
jgi:Domain of unknown function (DUF4382)